MREPRGERDGALSCDLLSSPRRRVAEHAVVKLRPLVEHRFLRFGGRHDPGPARAFAETACGDARKPSGSGRSTQDAYPARSDLACYRIKPSSSMMSSTPLHSTVQSRELALIACLDERADEIGSACEKHAATQLRGLDTERIAQSFPAVTGHLARRLPLRSLTTRHAR
jgi:hypothetical protein